MLRLDVLSARTVLTMLGRPALRAAAQLSPKIHSQPPNEHKNPVCDAQTSAEIGLDQPRKPLPRTRLNLLCFGGKAGDDAGVQRTRSARQTPKRATAKYQKMNKELLP